MRRSAEAAALAHAVGDRLLLLLLLPLLVPLAVLEVSDSLLRVRVALAQHLPHPGHRLAQQRQALAVPSELAIQQPAIVNCSQCVWVLARKRLSSTMKLLVRIDCNGAAACRACKT